MIKIKRALFSVSDKAGLVDFADFLYKRDVEIISTGGTLKALTEAGIPAIPIEAYTGFPEMMDGRLKTLHPKIHGGLLALRDNDLHIQSMKEHSIQGIDLVVVNLYPFAATIARNAPFAEAIENIDIGGPTMLRAAAKNYRFTVSLTRTDDYERIKREIMEKDGISEETSLEMARVVFNETASYDAMISSYLNEKANDKFPELLTMTYKKDQSLRYGENPHQEAAFYRPVLDSVSNQDGAEQIQGKELSFNNMLDLSSALDAALALPGPGIVIVKHLNPCGVATVRNDYKNRSESSLEDAFLRARACDPVSAFGGVIASSATIDGLTAERIAENFAECIIAPSFDEKALQVFSSKKNLRVIRLKDPQRFLKPSLEIRPVMNGILYEDRDIKVNLPSDWKVVTTKQPDEKILAALNLAWRLVKYVKSNAIVFTNESESLGIGAGQMSRVDAAEIAVIKANKNNISLQGSVVGSDAFFPFRDGLDAIAKAGAIAVIQPGGSVRDQEVIDAANEHGMVMIFTGMRHFRH